jgi:phosphatidylglycerol---prolipoprotein diacylglyceryl transferase
MLRRAPGRIVSMALAARRRGTTIGAMHPILVEIGPFRILTHDAFTVLALVVGLAIYYVDLRRRRWLDWTIVWISLAAILGAGIGARLITAWEHVEYYSALDGVPLTVAIEQSGKSILGALAGGYVAIVLSKRAFGYRRSTGDAYVLAIPVATAIGRVGCFLSELPLGIPTTLPWGVSVSQEAAAAFARCPGCDVPMHPSMLYEIAFNVVAAIVIVRYRDRVPVPGDALKLYLLAAGIFRFLVEFVRGNEPQALGLTGPQWVLIPLVALLVIHFARRLRTGAYRVPAPPPAVALEGPAT